jgi:hypothetical protein
VKTNLKNIKYRVLQKSSKSNSTENGLSWKYFDAPGSSSSNLVPASWKEFFIASLLNLSSFDWAKSFLSSDAWSIIMSANGQENAISFVVPDKCPVKRKLECVCTEEEQETEQSSLLESATSV